MMRGEVNYRMGLQEGAARERRRIRRALFKAKWWDNGVGDCVAWDDIDAATRAPRKKARRG